MATITVSAIFINHFCQILEVTCCSQRQPQWFDAFFGKCFPCSADGLLGCDTESTGCPNQNMVQVAITVKVKRVDVCVLMSTLKWFARFIAACQFLRYLPRNFFRNGNQGTMQQFRLR